MLCSGNRVPPSLTKSRSTIRRVPVSASHGEDEVGTSCACGVVGNVQRKHCLGEGVVPSSLLRHSWHQGKLPGMENVSKSGETFDTRGS